MATNDNTLKTLGFVYQAYIGLLKCLEMNESDKVIIENLGDVTIVSTCGVSQQIEVKHHIDKTTISDRNSEIWNTVWNWYNNFEAYHNIEEFILFTTASLSKNSVFRSWDIHDINLKYEVFKNIGVDVKGKERTFRNSYNNIFNNKHDADKLKSVLNRFKILSEQQTIHTIIEKNKNTFRFLGNKSRMEQFVSSLIGLLLTLPIKNECWEINYGEFDDAFKMYAQRFVDESTVPLQMDFEDYKASPLENKQLKRKRFVEEINRIDLIDEVSDAINDYCRTSKTIISFFDTNIVKSKDIKDYKKQLTKTLDFKRKSHKLKCKDDRDMLIPQSKEMYYDSMSMEARSIQGVSYNRDFFQRGVMHIIVDDGEITWYVGDEN